jgi:hypothetical protein
MRSELTLSRPFTAVLFVLVISVSASASYVGIQNRRLKHELAVALSNTHQLPADRPIPDLYGVTVTGLDVKIVFPSSKPLVFILVDRNCHFCKENWPWWKRIVSGVGHNAIAKVVDIRSTFTETDAAAAGIDPNTVVKLGLAAAKSMAYGTPTTAVVSRRGILVKSWAGVFNDERFKDLVATVTQSAGM